MGKLGIALNSTKFIANFIGSGFYANNIFDISSKRNRDDCLMPFYKLRKKFIESGIELNSADINRNAKSKFELHLDAQKTNNKTVPCYAILYESPQILPINNNSKYLNKYHRIFTWRDDLVDGKRFIKLNLPNKISTNDSRGWHDRNKFCCLISANKTVPYKTELELYSERVNTIRWFEENHPKEFDLFGNGWDTQAAIPSFTNRLIRRFNKYFPNNHDTVFFPSYRGKVISKIETLQNYRFNICYENIRDLSGYITEKIWDCFFAGCIPVYWGASNVTDYIPENCFIDRRKFSTHDELYEHMSSITEPEYIDFQERIAVFLSSEKAKSFNIETFTDTIVNTIARDIKFAS